MTKLVSLTAELEGEAGFNISIISGSRTSDHWYTAEAVAVNFWWLLEDIACFLPFETSEFSKLVFFLVVFSRLRHTSMHHSTIFSMFIVVLF